MTYQLMLIDENKNEFWYCGKSFHSIREAKDYYEEWGVKDDVEDFCKNCEVRPCDLSVFVINENLSADDFYFVEEILERA